MWSVQTLAREAMERIRANGKIPMVVGGTGFYIQALLYDIDFTENDGDTSFREMLEHRAAAGEGEELHRMLQACDPKAAEQIHPHNVKRVIRALEFHHQTGRKISDHNEAERQKESPYNYAYFVLTDERSRLYERIDRQVNEMMEQGLLDEVKALGRPASRAGRPPCRVWDIKSSTLIWRANIPSARRCIIKRDTRHFAKRQLTWFKRGRM